MHQLPDLAFAKDSLAPHMSAETLEYHHGKHHATYVSKLNSLIENSEFADAKLEDIVKNSSGGIFNNAAQHWNHSFFWKCLTPDSNEPQGELMAELKKTFGSFEKFKEKFSETAITTFGSGWAWLVKKDGKLELMSTSNADSPMCHGATALLTCDVWEHAYYIDYRNARPKFLEAFWNIVNWKFVAENF